MLKLLGFEIDDAFESGLLAAGISIPLIGFAVYGLSIPGWLGLRSAWGLVALLAIAGWRGGWSRSGGWARLVLKQTRTRVTDGGLARRAVLMFLAFTVLFEALVSMAPLTGSDAMTYHFTVPLLESVGPLHPIFWLTPSFLTGQAHLLISLGMALGSDRISLGLIFTGGLLTAAVLFTIARQLMPFDWAVLTVLTFLISPMVFWQITTSGSPDIWMAFYTGLAAIAANRGIQSGDLKFVLLAGFYAGAAAGVKYTGWIVPFAICAYVLFERRSWKPAFLCGLISLIVGALPQVRNFIWTGDPFFPFLMPMLNSAAVNWHALHSLLAETRALSYSRDLLHLLAFPFTMALYGDQYGLGQYFGPLILAFAPLLLFARWKSHTARLGGVIWVAMLLATALSTQTGRFLLPVYIFALALVFSGLAEIFERNWKIAAYGCAATLAVFLGFAAFSDSLYARDFLPPVLGRENREAFLRRTAPEYQFASFINSALGQEPRNGTGRAMIFLRHLYYVRVPYVYGDPKFSWAVDPAKCSEPGGLLRLLRELDVKWVVKDPGYPPALENSFRQLEDEKKLIPIASSDLETLTGISRIYQERQTTRVTLMKLVD